MSQHLKSSTDLAEQLQHQFENDQHVLAASQQEITSLRKELYAARQLSQIDSGLTAQTASPPETVPEVPETGPGSEQPTANDASAAAAASSLPPTAPSLDATAALLLADSSGHMISPSLAFVTTSAATSGAPSLADELVLFSSYSAVRLSRCHRHSFVFNSLLFFWQSGGIIGDTAGPVTTTAVQAQSSGTAPSVVCTTEPAAAVPAGTAPVIAVSAAPAAGVPSMLSPQQPLYVSTLFVCTVLCE